MKMRPIDRYEKIQEVLLEQGRKLELALVFDLMSEEQAEWLASSHQNFSRALKGVFQRDYRAWHGNASALIRQVSPNKHDEFVSYFLANPSRKVMDPIAAPLREWLNGAAPGPLRFDGTLPFNPAAVVGAFFSNQLRILQSCQTRNVATQKSPETAVPLWVESFLKGNELSAVGACPES